MNMLNSYVTFSVNKDKKVVVCFLSKGNLSELIFSYFGKTFSFLEEKQYYNYIKFVEKEINSTLASKDRIMTSAKCAEEDEFNEEVGKAIALSKMSKRIKLVECKIMTDISEDLAYIYNNVFSCMCNSLKKVIVSSERTKYLIDNYRSIVDESSVKNIINNFYDELKQTT